MKKEIKELEEMGAFVDLLINEGVKAGNPFYINLKNRENEKKETNIKKN